MIQTENINLPILQEGDKYSKDIQNQAFRDIDREIKGLNDRVKILDNVEGSIIETKEDVEALKINKADTITTNNKFEQTNQQINKINEQLDNIVQHSFNSSKTYSVENLNSLELQSVINSMNDNDTLIMNGVFIINESVIFSKDINIIGNNSILVTNKEGLDCTFIFNNCSFTLDKINFNQNLKGRTSVEVNNCNNFRIENCSFTGYSKEYDYYKTDGGIRINNSKFGTISKCYWVEHGNQYDTTSANLNRCVTIQDNSDFITIDNCKVNKVNQGFVVASGKANKIINCDFNEVNDNGIYIVENIGGCIISKNNFINMNDEAIVLKGNNVLIDCNNFNGVTNNVIAFCGSTINCKIINNNTIGGNFIKQRSEYPDDVQTNLLVKNNTVSTGNVYAVIQIIKGENCIIADNTLECNISTAYRYIIKFEDTSSAKIYNNELINIGTAQDNTYAIYLPTSFTKGIIQNNNTKGCRIKDESLNANIINQTLTNSNYMYGGSINIISGSGSPEGLLKCKKGTMFTRTDTSTDYSLYIKTTDKTVNTGWIKIY